jgi:hypothetical protein
MQAIESKRGADEIAIKPQLMVRQSTVAARKKD